MINLPHHLQKYIVDQAEVEYTPVDQAVWRFIMRQLKTFLVKNAHQCYAEGLEKTGIQVEQIPQISEMSKKLQELGWRAVPVSGFIPPAAFMEMQSLGILPIATDMRTLDHLEYTPAPDIVHEAAGHAPILINPEFSDYLHEYANVSKKAIINHKDMALYEAIRDLSDLKENPSATPEEVKAASEHLESISSNMGEPSEAALLARMNWWTAEYGLIGHPNDPKIYGAGLLSSVGESRTALQEDKTKILPFDLSCLDYSYDITEPQPQLFVTSSFKLLKEELQKFAKTMAFNKGGKGSLKKAIDAKTVNTVEVNTGVQVSGIVSSYMEDNDGEPCYLQFEGPCQISYSNIELQGHGKDYHKEGFSSPIGQLKGADKCLSEFNENDLQRFNIVEGQSCFLNYKSGVLLHGKLEKILKDNHRNLIFTFSNCRISYDDMILFEPAWGPFDLVAAAHIPSVFGGPADRKSYGETEYFCNKRVPSKQYSETDRKLMSLYEKVRKLRKHPGPEIESSLKMIYSTLEKEFPQDWLLELEIIELEKHIEGDQDFIQNLENSLKQKAANSKAKDSIMNGLELSNQLYV